MTQWSPQDYEQMIAQVDTVDLETLEHACNTLHATCQQNTQDVYCLKLLERLLMTYYEKQYPNHFGGIFEPLTATIGYTHCHYLEPKKFINIPQNQYWLRFNILTCQIEHLPSELQPETLPELIRIVHLISYIKNSYFDKHVAYLTEKNQHEYV